MRWLAVEGEAAPRPLRDEQHPWRRDGLTKKELQQLKFGNKLLYFAIRLSAALLRTGGFSATEHPSSATWLPQAASIWKLPEISWQRQTTAAQLLRFRQGDMGQIGVKPTTLLTIRLPTLKMRIKHNTLPSHSHVTAPLQGRNPDGTWATTRSKEYPVLLNKALAESMLDSIRKVHRQKPRHWSQQQQRDAEQLLQDFDEFIVHHDGYESQPADVRPAYMHHRVQ